MAKELMTGWLNSGVNPLSALEHRLVGRTWATGWTWLPPSLLAAVAGGAPDRGRPGPAVRRDDHHGEVLVTPKGSI